MPCASFRLTFSSVPTDNARQAGQSPSHPTSWVLGAVAWLAPQAPIETLSIDRAKRQSKLDKTYRLLVPRPSLEFSGPGEGQSAGRPTKTKGAGRSEERRVGKECRSR